MVFSVLPLAVLAVYNFFSTSNNFRETTTKELFDLVKNRNTSVTDHLNEMKESTKFVEGSFAFKNLIEAYDLDDPDEIYYWSDATSNSLRSYINSKKELLSIAYYNELGIQKIFIDSDNIGLETDLENPRLLSDIDLQKSIKSKNNDFLYLLDNKESKKTLTIAHHFMDEYEEYAGVLAISFSADYIFNIFRNIPKKEVLILSKEKEFIYSSGKIDPAKYTTDLVKNSFEAISNLNEGTFEGEDGRIFSFSKISFSPSNEQEWGILLSQSDSELTGRIFSFISTISLIGFVISLIALIIAYKVSQNFSKPILSLSEAADRVAAGEKFKDLQITTKDEIGKLTKNFNVMANKIESDTSELLKSKNNLESKEIALNEMIQQSEKLTDYLSKSVEELLFNFELFSEGDLTVQVNKEIKDDDVGRLYLGFNKSVQKICKTLEHVLESSSQTTSGVNDITSGLNELSDSANKQAAEVTSIAASIEEMTSTIASNSKNALEVEGLAKTNGKLANEGVEVVINMVDKINHIGEVINKSRDTIEKLGNASAEIGNIVLVINDISEQTNLLALNAAIEAARAGEHGKGFAVVADEVSKLSERTSEATKKISETIKNIQDDTKIAVNSMQIGSSEITEGMELADTAKNSLTNVSSSANNLVTTIAQIATANEQQSSTSMQIVRNIETISQYSTDLSNGVSDIYKSAEGLNNMAVGLTDLLSSFELNLSGKSNNYSVKEVV